MIIQTFRGLKDDLGGQVKIRGREVWLWYKMLYSEYYENADQVSAIRCTENNTSGSWAV